MIDKPEFSHNAGIYICHWPDLKLVTRVERLNEGSRDTLSGLITVIQKSPGFDELLEQNRINLDSAMARNQFAKALTERVNHIDWVSVVKYACVLTSQEYRKGEPILDLGGEPSKLDLQYRLYPIIEEGQPTTIFAPGGSGKSYVADYICVLLQYNYPGLKEKWMPSLGGCNCLYLDWETSFDTHARRIWAIKRGLDINDDSFIKYRFCSQPLAYDAAEIQKIILENDIKFLVVDSQMAACPDESATANTQFYNALRSFRITTLTLDHVTKTADKNTKEAYGSVVKWNRARSVFGLWNHQETGQSSMELGLYHKKHNDGINLHPIGMRVEFDGSSEKLNKVTFTSIDVADDPELIKGMELKYQLKNYLKSGALSVEELSDITGKDKETIRVTLSSKKNSDTFIKVGKSTYGLLQKENP